ncbi:FAD-dependent monooxygenase [Amycolatopsis minnesotensis]|uniref:FAD-dependent monooxygenase n=2 Tax=Amycolatopsis minnesotensis TaxID=337894 RepID=A0ABP5DGU8_9PSEU
MKDMAKALIIGGGIAGTVTAMALRKAGHDVRLYEAYDRSADGVGAFLTLAVNGLDALDALDLKDLVKGLGFDTPKMSLSLGDGHRLAEFPLGGAMPDGTVSQTVRRSDLYVALRDEAVRRGVHTEYGKRLVSASETADGVRARFADGTEADGDLLIGADGLRSQVRRIIDPAAPAPRYIPLLNTGGFTRDVEVGGEPGVMHMTFGKRLFHAYVPRPGGEVWWFANLPRRREPTQSELAGITSEEWRAKLLRLTAGDRSPIGAVIEATEEISTPWSTYDFPSVPNWRTARMVIIGDAAHATSPAAGQGAAMALEDAVTLGRCLRDSTVPEALRHYEKLRRARVERVVEQGKRNGSNKMSGPVSHLIRDAFLRRAFRNPKAGQDAGEWMWAHHIDWATPVTA